ncbi:MAG: hypothetical protein AAB552_03300 [Patescibacteria group bacterium]
MRQKQSLFKEPKKQITILTRPSKKFKDKFDLLTNDPSFQKDIKLLRDKWGINLEQSRLIVRERNSLVPLLKKYNLSEDWEYVIGMYIHSNEFEEMGDPHGLQIRLEGDKKSATLKIYPETTSREIRSAHSTIIKIIKRGKIIKTRPADKFERDSYIYELYLKGKLYKEISVLVTENYNEQIDKFELSKIVAKMKKRRAGI